MTLSLRLVATVLTSVGLAIVGVAIVMGLLAREALLDQAEARARLIAGLIAAEANRAEAFLGEIDAASLLEIEAQAVAIDRLVDTSRPDELAKTLAEITAFSVIDDIWALDGSGRPIARAVNGVGASGVEDMSLDEAGIDRRALEPLLSGKRFAVSLRSTPRDEFERTLRYVSVRLRPDRFVLVGHVEDESGGPVPAADLAEALAEQEGVEAIWVVDDRLEVVAAAVGDDRETVLPESGRALAERVLNAAVIDRAADKAAFSSVGDDALHVAAPILGRWSIATGVVVIRLPRAQSWTVCCWTSPPSARSPRFWPSRSESMIAIVSARRIVRPVTALTQGAEEMDPGQFRAGLAGRRRHPGGRAGQSGPGVPDHGAGGAEPRAAPRGSGAGAHDGPAAQERAAGGGAQARRRGTPHRPGASGRDPAPRDPGARGLRRPRPDDAGPGAGRRLLRLFPACPTAGWGSSWPTCPARACRRLSSWRSPGP